MKYIPETVNKIIEALADGQGRVGACKMAGITHDTLMNWIEKYSDFSDSIKKAESSGDDKIKDLQKRKIIEDKSWTSGAWWLERNYPDQYRQRIEQTGDPIIPNLGLSYEELCKLKYGKAGD
jgi:hypothetical protein